MQEHKDSSESLAGRSGNKGRTARNESLCRSLGESLHVRLSDIGDVYRESEEELAALGGRPMERISGTRSVGIRLDERVLSLRSQIADLLSSWAGLVVAERGSVAAPGGDVPALLRFLGNQVRWLSRHPAGPDFDVELAALVDTSRSLLGPRVHRVSLGTCCHPGCTAPLFALLSGTGEAAFSRVACDRGHAIPPAEWLQLSGRVRMAMNGGGP